MEPLYNVQFDKVWAIERSRTNFKKTPKSRITYEYVETRLQCLENAWSVFLENHTNIVKTASQSERKTDRYFIDNVFDSAEEFYITYKAELKQLMVSRKEDSDENISEKTSKKEVKLPDLHVPIFSGDYAQWKTFEEMFLALIHNNNNLEDIQRLQYLKSFIAGEAAQLICNIPITAANYKICFDKLCKTYNNKRYQCNSLLERMFTQSNVSENAKSIKSLLSTTSDCRDGLRNLGIDIDASDYLIIYLMTQKLDVGSRKKWEEKMSVYEDLPKFDEFEQFLFSRYKSLEFLDTDFKGKRSINRAHFASSVNTEIICPFCNGNHKIINCKQFAKETFESRSNFVQTQGLCYNCLGSNHSIKYCRQNTTCRICRRRHHSLLHPKLVSNTAVIESSSHEENFIDKVESTEPTELNNIATHFSKELVSTQVLLATALVKAQTRSGANQLLRVLLDQGSQASFISESAVQLLGLKKSANKSVISGVGGDKNSFSSEFVVTVHISSRIDPSCKFGVQAIVLSKITSLMPLEKIPIINWPELKEITLADPEYHTPNKIDILLGADIYSQVLREGLIQGPPGYPVVQNTKFGWILSGQVSTANNIIRCHHVISSFESQADDNALLKQFWEIETVIPNPKVILSEEEQRCEDLFKTTTYRDENGRYVVKIPFRNNNPQCQYGNSKELSLKRFKYLENKFQKNNDLKKRYSEVIHEYIELGHMELVPNNNEKTSPTCYLPHHAVVRDDRLTTKVRVVFDASMKGVNGVSLNDDMMIGPRLQPPLRHILMRWRKHPISICADIVKMYRQVLVAPEHVNFQRILWRDDPNSEIREYRLLRVTFGTASAPYLAVKSLQQVAIDECVNYPEIGKKITNDFYVDDLMSGCQSIEEGIEIHKKLSEVLNKAGFQLQKWVSSNEELHEKISENVKEIEVNNNNRKIKMDEVMKILGIAWDRKTDEFRYTINLPTQQIPITKRRVISDISRIFDPLGWAAPCVVVSKIFIQKLWLSGLGWDDELNEELKVEWQRYRDNLSQISKFKIPRWMNTRLDDLSVELHGFCDASISAYAAVVYTRIIDFNSKVHVNLVTCRTKVAPVKQISVPRLELMGATLLSELIIEVAEVLYIPKKNIYAWTDSTVVLAWLSSHPSRWSTFVGNRVSTILSFLENSHWAHVQTDQNPADIASRGLTALELSSCTLWTQGPSWLAHRFIEFKKPTSIATSMEMRQIKAHFVSDNIQEDTVWSKFSDLQKMVRVIAYCKRVSKWKRTNVKRYEQFLTTDELDEAVNICIKYVQNKEFQDDIIALRTTDMVKYNSKLKPLCPFFDSNGIMRVGGRIELGNSNENFKHPIILPHNNHFTNLIIKDAHLKSLHGGVTLMLSYLRSKYWIVGAKTLVKAFIRNCVICKRYSTSNQTQYMGQLPLSRITPARVFQNSGVDFAGPINIRASKGRGHTSYKGYICLFVCMSTKAIHLEAVSDLTSQGFIACFKRFVARRGHVSDIWSDNGSNFVGASKELSHFVTEERSCVAMEIRQWLGNNGTSWHFIPPRAPNFGGLWEAGIKSTKSHLNRVISDSTLTYEEMSTVLCQIEACLNSRPLSIVLDDPNGAIPLTPGHFLVGEPLMTVPDRNYENANVSSLRRWQITQRMLQTFWRRWSQEYLAYLMQRYKWTKHVQEPNIGDIVLIKEDNLPPAKWLMGKIIDKHPGLDNITRVVTLKCNNSFIKRAVSKLCVLPVAT